VQGFMVRAIKKYACSLIDDDKNVGPQDAPIFIGAGSCGASWVGLADELVGGAASERGSQRFVEIFGVDEAHDDVWRRGVVNNGGIHPRHPVHKISEDASVQVGSIHPPDVGDAEVHGMIEFVNSVFSGPEFLHIGAECQPEEAFHQFRRLKSGKFGWSAFGSPCRREAKAFCGACPLREGDQKGGNED
jgi:hypothetical protein